MPVVKWQALDTCDFGLLQVSGRLVKQSQGFTVDHTRRGRGTSGLILVTAGSLTFHQEGLPELPVGPSALCLLPQGCRYRLSFHGEETVLMLLNFTLFIPQGEPILPGEQVELLSRQVTDPRIPRLFEDLLRCLELRASPLRQKELLYRLFGLLFEEANIRRMPAEKYANLAPGVLLLRQTFLEELPIGQFARACSISDSSFRSLFTELYGISPLRYRNRLRINYARQLLTDSSCTVREAAERSGFSNLGYFCRLYKRATGETPGQTRSRYSG